MVKSRLNIGGTNVGFMTELPISTNFSVADVREPEKRNGATTKTILIPGSAEVKQLFEFIFQVNSQLTNFNPNLKIAAKYFVNEVLVFDGSLQLLRINNKFINDYESSTFECSLIGDNSNLFLDIAGLKLTDIDFSDLDHTFTFTSSMFAPSVIGEGYAYPYNDYGQKLDGTMQSNMWAFRFLKPAIFENEIVRRIASNAGYTVESGGYFDTSYSKRIIIPDVNAGSVQMAPADVALNECYVGLTSDQSSITDAGSYTSIFLISYGFAFFGNGTSILFPIPFDDETTPYSDGGVWDGVTDFEMTVNDEGHYALSCNLDVDFVFDSYPVGAASMRPSQVLTGGYNLDIHFQKSLNGGATWATIGTASNTVFFNELVSTTSYAVTVSGSMPDVYLYPGNLIRIALFQGQGHFIQYFDGGGTEVTAGSASIHFDVKPGSSFQASIAKKDLIEGNTVRMNTTIPPNVTQLDFITSIIKLENLYVEASKAIKNQYVIKTREEFIDLDVDNALTWTDKWDISQPQEVIPMGELDFSRLLFTYKSDKDHYNQRYENFYKEVYGTEAIDVENDFIKKEKKIEVVFSPSPMVGTDNIDIVATRFMTIDSTTNVVKPAACNIRRLYWGGLLPCNDHVFIYNSAAVTRNTYPFAGHVDNPKNPTVDLCWDNPLELYYNYPGIQYTDNNRYNARWSKFISEITDQNSKIVRMWFYLTESDINSFSFSKLVFVRDTYYLVNKIIDYNPQKKSVTQVELLKLKAGAVFVPDVILFEDLGGSGEGGSDRLGNTNNGNGILLGSGNYNNKPGSFIVGNGNVIG